MNIIICGAGILGESIAKYLASKGDHVTVIDNNPKLISKLLDNIDCRTVLGNSANPSVLEKADCSSADIIIAATKYDEINIVTCQVAHTLFNVPKKIARIRDNDYQNKKWSKLFSDFLDIVISPENEIAESIFKRIETTGCLDIHPACNDMINILKIKIGNHSKLINTPLDRLLALYDEYVLGILFISRNDKQITINNKTQLKTNDIVYFACKKKQTEEILSLFGVLHEKIEKIIIIGGGHIGQKLVRLLQEKTDIYIKIIERNNQNALSISEKFPGLIVLNGDALDTSLLEEAGVHNYDMIVNITNNDETNLLSSLLTKQLGAKKTIALIKNQSYKKIPNDLNIDVVVNPKKITTNTFLRHIVSNHNHSFAAINEQKDELLEIKIQKNSPIIGKPIKNILLNKYTTIGVIVRSNKIFTPLKTEIFKENDIVILCAKSKDITRIKNLYIIE